jgi:hypothetical protein
MSWWEIGIKMRVRNAFATSEIEAEDKRISLTPRRRMYARRGLHHTLEVICKIFPSSTEEWNQPRWTLLEKILQARFLDHEHCISALLCLSPQEDKVLWPEFTDGAFCLDLNAHAKDELTQRNPHLRVYYTWFIRKVLPLNNR